jgi:hypothetical protein
MRLERLAWLLLLACETPIAAVPTMATATKDVVICWRDTDDGDDGANAAISRGLAKRLRGAGYHVITKGVCEVSLEWGFSSRGHENENDSSYRAATITLRADKVIDNIKLEWGPGQVPTDDSDRLAILMVNAMNASAKFAEYAANNARSATEDRAVPGLPADPKQRREPSF